MRARLVTAALLSFSLEAVAESGVFSPGTEADGETGIRQTCLWPDGRLLWAGGDILDCSIFSGKDVPNALYREPRKNNPVVLF